MKVELIALRSIRVGGTYFWAPALEFSTLLEVTEAGTIHVHASCTRPTRCTPVILGFKGVKWGSKLSPYRHCQCLRHLLWGSRSGIFDVVGGNRGCSNVRLGATNSTLTISILSPKERGFTL